MSRNHCARLIAAACLLLAGPAAVAEALDRATVQRWMSAMGELMHWVEGLEGEAPELHEGDFFDDGVMPDFSQVERAYRELVSQHREAGRIIERHGFRDAGSWAGISSRILQALIAIEMQSAQPEIDAHMAEALRQLDANPHLPPEQREAMRQQMLQAMGSMGQMSSAARSEDLPAVRALREELRQVLEMHE